MPGKPFIEDNLGSGLGIIFVVGTRDSLGEFREVVYYDQETGVTRLGFAQFQMVKLHQVVEVAAVDVLQGVAGVSGRVFGLLAG